MIESGLGTTRQMIQAFGQAIVGEHGPEQRQMLTGAIAVAENTAHALRKATVRLVTSLLESYQFDPDQIIFAFFITDLTAEYPARAVRESLGWHDVPMLCAQEVRPGIPDQSSVSSVLLIHSRLRTQPAERGERLLRGLRGATNLNQITDENIQNEARWLFNTLLAQNNLDLTAIARGIITVTPDLDPDTILAAAQAIFGPAIPLLIANEIAVPGAPRRCIRALLIARTAQTPRPVYSESARILLRPDLPRAISQSVRIGPSGPLQGTLTLPGSKYHTLRAILAAFLANGESFIDGPALSDDTTVLLTACAQLGATIEASYQSDGRCLLRIRGVSGRIQPSAARARINVGNAGAVLRLLLGICAASSAEITFTTASPESLGRRPNADLLQALASLGALITSQEPDGTLPITIQGAQLRGGKVLLSGKQSSQYLSALLYLGPLLEAGLEIEITDTLASASFVDLTIQVLQKAGITIITQESYRRYRVPGKQRYLSQTYHIPGDYPSAAALLAAVAVAKGQITLQGLPPDSVDGEAMLDAFSQMGLEITRSGTGITARAQGPLLGIRFDGSMAIDSVPCIAAAACFATTPSVIFNIANLRLKECDRIYDLAAALQSAGCRIEPSSDALTISPADAVAGGVEIDAHADHRLAQAVAVIGLGSQAPITLRQAQHVAKSYPRFFDDLASLGVKTEPVR